MDSRLKKAEHNKPGRATLVDVAARAGVSVSTASLVLANKARERRISDEVHRRVRAAANELDYSPNLLVRSMQRGRTNVVSLYNSFRYRWTGDVYWDRFSTAIEAAAGRKGYDVLVHCDFNRSAEATYGLLNGGRADGLLLFAPTPDEPLLPYLQNSRLPVVLTHTRSEISPIASVTDDLESGMCQVAERLYALGHRRIAAITSELPTNRDARPRIAAMSSVLAQWGVQIPAHWIVAADTRENYARAINGLMAEPYPPTALFCWNDHAGYQALDQCETAGIAVPDRLSIVGYDGQRWPSISGHILASVHVDLERLAAEAIELLDGLITGKEVDTRKILDVELRSGTTLQTV